MLQNIDADILRAHELHWQQSWNWCYVLETSEILRQL